MSGVFITSSLFCIHSCFADTDLRNSRSGLYNQGTVDRFLEMVNDKGNNSVHVEEIVINYLVYMTKYLLDLT